MGQILFCNVPVYPFLMASQSVVALNAPLVSSLSSQYTCLSHLCRCG